jgi:predicted Zn-dependent peptidase
MHSRIFGEARRLGLVYDIRSDTSAYEHNSSWDFGAEANSDKLELLFDVIIREIGRIKDGQISDEELDDAKGHALGRYQMGIQTVGQLNNWFADRYFMDGRIDDFKALPKKIRAVTRSKIVSVAKEFLNANCWGVGIYGNTNKAVAEALRDKLGELYQ